MGDQRFSRVDDVASLCAQLPEHKSRYQELQLLQRADGAASRWLLLREAQEHGQKRAEETE